MNINKASFVISAVSNVQYPKDNLPEIALAGRSNVGKSSFINTLINRKNLVRTSSKPGKTRTLNFYHINDAFYFVDVPGYGYAKVSKTERNKWGRMIEEYIETRESLRVIVLILDIRHEPSKEDLQMINYLRYYEIPILIIATKMDKISKTKQSQYINKMNNYLQDKSIEVIPFSSITKENKNKVWQRLKNYL